MSNVYDTELLIRMMDGELPDNEESLLRARLQTEPELQNEWSAISLTRELLQQAGKKRDISAIHLEMMAERAKQNQSATGVIRMFPGRILRIRGLRAVAAALVLILTATLYPYFSSTSEKLYQGQEIGYTPGRVRGTEQTRIAGDYSAGNPGKTIADYQAGLAQGPADDFLAGMAYLQLKQPLAAVNAFRTGTAANEKAGTHYFEAETNYYLALAWLGAGEPKKALPLFEKIRADQGHPYHDRVSWWFMVRLRRLASR